MACRHDQDDLLNFKQNIRMRRKGDLSDFEHGTAVGARRAGLSISESADLLGFSHTTISRVYDNSRGENALLMPDVRGE